MSKNNRMAETGSITSMTFWHLIWYYLIIICQLYSLPMLNIRVTWLVCILIS